MLYMQLHGNGIGVGTGECQISQATFPMNNSGRKLWIAHWILGSSQIIISHFSGNAQRSKVRRVVDASVNALTLNEETLQFSVVLFFTDVIIFYFWIRVSTQELNSL